MWTSPCAEARQQYDACLEARLPQQSYSFAVDSAGAAADQGAGPQRRRRLARGGASGVAASNNKGDGDGAASSEWQGYRVLQRADVQYDLRLTTVCLHSKASGSV